MNKVFNYNTSAVLRDVVGRRGFNELHSIEDPLHRGLAICSLMNCGGKMDCHFISVDLGQRCTLRYNTLCCLHCRIFKW